MTTNRPLASATNSNTVPTSLRSASAARRLPLPLLLLLLLGPWPVPAQQGRMEQGQITSSALATNLYRDPATRSYRVYLPPSYDTTTNRYPVVYVLHGYLGNDSSMVSLLQTSLDLMIRQRSIGELIAVFPNASNRLCGSYYLSSPVIGDYETYIVRDLVGLIDTRYRTLPARASRGVTGQSMGGWGTMHLALKFPDVFSVAVAEAGSYNSRSAENDARAISLASYHPTDFDQFVSLMSIDWHLCALQAQLAGLLPNPERPWLYTDYPYEWVDGEAVFNAEADELCRERDVQNGDLPRYADQPIRLNGIKIVHGINDGDRPVASTRAFTNALYQAGIPFVYEEHTGGHEYRAELALPFLSSHLQGAARYIARPRLTFGLNTNGLQVVFPTQTGVQYRVESAPVLKASGTNWSERRQVTGDGQSATLEFPREAAAQFFRVKAANLP